MNRTRAAWLVVALLLPVALLNYLDRQMLAAMKFSVMADIPTIATEANWGRMLGQFKWVYAFLSPIGGYLADRFSRRHVICGSLFVWSAVTWATGHVTTYDGLLLDPLADGHQRGVLHPGGARADRRLPPRAHPLARGGPAPDGHLLRRHRRRLRRLRGRQPGARLALGLRRLRRGRHGLRPAAGVPAARRARERHRRGRRRGSPARSSRRASCWPTAPSSCWCSTSPCRPWRAGWCATGCRPSSSSSSASARARPASRRRSTGRSRRSWARFVGGWLADRWMRRHDARAHLHERHRHEPHRPRDVRRGQRRHAGGGGGLPRPVRARLGLLRLQQHAHPLPDRAPGRCGPPATAS